jgi:hypothetical protein
MKASILAALLLAWAFPAAAQTNNPAAPIPQQENQLWRQNQIESLVRDQQMYDLSRQQDIERLQQQIDGLNQPDSPGVNQADLNRLQLALDRLQNEQQLQRLEAERRIVQIERQGDTARRRRWAAQLAREQETERVEQRRRLGGIAEELRRFSAK